jgi:hypothetical protein
MNLLLLNVNSWKGVDFDSNLVPIYEFVSEKNIDILLLNEVFGESW